MPMTQFMSSSQHLSPSANVLRHATNTSNTTTTSFTNGATREEGSTGNNVQEVGFLGYNTPNCGGGVTDTSCNSSLAPE